MPEAHRELQAAQKKIESVVAEALDQAPWTEEQKK
jgi:exonuclease VII small subunit